LNIGKMKISQQNSNKKKSLILLMVKKIVSSDGWSSDVIKKLIEAGVKSTDLTFFFKNDYKKILECSLKELNKINENRIKKINIINLPLNKRIKKILMMRINIINEDKDFYKKTFYHLMLPQNLKILKANLYRSVDNMWYIAGDNSTDFNFYTKRIILATIYTNALHVLFNHNFDQVEINIDNNLKKVSKIPKIKERFSFLKENIPFFLKGFFN